MRETITTLFIDYSAIMLFFHVLSAVVWIGGMVAIRFAVHPAIQSLEDNRLKLGKTIEIVGRLFNIVIIFIIILIFTATIMAVGMDFKHSPLYWLVHVKEGIWMVMTMNFTYMYIKRLKAKKLYDSGDLAGAKKQIGKFANILLPINIILGVLAIYAGVTLRGF
jgi:uncharacterized membrane protein